MHVPPIIPAKPASPATAPATSTGSGGEEFASMIPTVQDDGHPVESTDVSGSETSSDPAVVSHGEQIDVADQTMVQLSDNVLQSLIAETKVRSDNALQSGSELRRIGDIEAALTTQTAPKATNGDSATIAGIASDQPVIAGQATEPSPSSEPAVSTPVNSNGESEGSNLPGETLTNIAKPTNAAKPPPDQPAQAMSAQQAKGGSIIAAPSIHDSPVLPPIPSPAGAIDASAANNVQTLPLPVSPLPLQVAASTDLGLARQDIKPQGARAVRSETNTQSATPGPASGANSGNTPAQTQTQSVMANAATANPEFVSQDSPLEITTPTAGTASDGAATKIPSPTPGASANPAASQSGMITDTAAAFGSDLRLGTDGIRPAAVEQAFRGQPLQPASEQVAVQISRAIQQGADRITINLKPASLGLISVDLEVGPDNRLIAVVSADRPETLDLMQRDARALERALNDAGLKTDSGSLSFNLRGDGGKEHADGDNATDWSSFAAPNDTDGPTPTPVYARTLSAEGGIDIRV